MGKTTVATHYKKRPTTIRRHEIVIQKFNEISSITFKGLHPSIDSVLKKVHQETGYSIRTIEDIIRAGVS